MIVNTNPETGIRYGVVSMNSLESWVWEEFYTQGTDESYAEAMREWQEENPDAEKHEEYTYGENLEIEESEWSLDIEGMKLRISWLGGAPLLWVFESPHKAAVSLCSPCVPNAGDLNNKVPLGQGFACYDVPADWYAAT